MSKPTAFGSIPLSWLALLFLGAATLLGSLWATARIQAADARCEDLHTELRLAELALASERQHREAERILARHAAATPLNGYRIVPLAYEGTTPPPLMLLWDMAHRRTVLCGGPLNALPAGPAHWEIILAGQCVAKGAIHLDPEMRTFVAMGDATGDVRLAEPLILRVTIGPDQVLVWHGQLPNAAP